jgi:hypothetical protein
MWENSHELPATAPAGPPPPAPGTPEPRLRRFLLLSGWLAVQEVFARSFGSCQAVVLEIFHDHEDF